MDDRWLKKLEYLNSNAINISSNDSRCNGFFKILSNKFDGLELRFVGSDQDVLIPALFGEFNAYNVAMSVLIARKIGISWHEILIGLKSFSGVPGRLQRHTLQNGVVAFVDFAHNPSSMKNVLSMLSLQTNDLITVFGCGGDRDREKRGIMGKIAYEKSDQIIITDDNPRDEDRFKILNEIYNGIKSKNKDRKVKIIPDRYKAIAHASAISKKGSIIALLGKGHEKYYLVKEKKHFFDDFEEISKF